MYPYRLWSDRDTVTWGWMLDPAGKNPGWAPRRAASPGRTGWTVTTEGTGRRAPLTVTRPCWATSALDEPSCRPYRPSPTTYRLVLSSKNARLSSLTANVS